MPTTDTPAATPTTRRFAMRSEDIRPGDVVPGIGTVTAVTPERGDYRVHTTPGRSVVLRWGRTWQGVTRTV